MDNSAYSGVTMLMTTMTNTARSLIFDYEQCGHTTLLHSVCINLEKMIIENEYINGLFIC